MNGARTLVQSLIAGGVDTCFANPGTSEMHFVSALDHIEGIRCVLALFEGIATGAADGYYRMADKPAATLLHLAPGLANGLANLHNAKKAHSGIVNIVGDHATYYAQRESPLSGDIETVARPMSNWVRRTASADCLAADAAEAIRLARQSPGQVATLILPADISWGPGGNTLEALPPTPRTPVQDEAVSAAAEALRAAGSSAVLLLGNIGVRSCALEWAGRISAITGCRLLAEIHNPRIERGAGRVPVTRIPYTQPVENATRVLAGTKALVLAGAASPLAFFAYPEKPFELAPAGCSQHKLAGFSDDIEGALEALCHRLGGSAKIIPATSAFRPPDVPDGPLTKEGMGAVIAALLPENAIVVDESVTAGRSFYGQSTEAAPHDWLVSTGASIGYALPSAIGAAVATPDRKVLALSGDGSGMYTLQSLWTMAREGLDVTVVIFANRAYQILQGEMVNMGSVPIGPRAERMLTIDAPSLDWCALAKGHGVEAGRARDLGEFANELRRGFASQGPYLIEVVL